MNFKFIKYLLFIFGLLLPAQFGKHFWPSWSYVLGVRIDYLSPTIYVTDILAILIIFLWVVEGIKYRRDKRVKRDKDLLPLSLFLLSLSIGIFLSKNPLAGWYGFIKLLEFTLLGFALRFYFQKERYRKIFFLGIMGSILYESILAVWQFYLQRSIGGIWYFLGERTFSSQTLGIANMSLGGALSLRPYGTFSHPNVLAAYLLIALIWIVFGSFASEKTINIFLRVLVFILGSFALLITFSRSVIFLWIIFTAFVIYHYAKKYVKKVPLKMVAGGIFFIVLLSIVIITPLRERFLLNNFSDESFTMRIELMKASFLMIKTYPVLGLGFDNFFSDLPEYSSILFRTNYIQPVHNIFLFVFAQTGIVGLLFFLWFIIKSGIKIFFNKSPLFFRLGFLSFLFLGNIDHYFLTLQQGQLLTTIIFALIWREGISNATVQI